MDKLITAIKNLIRLLSSCLLRVISFVLICIRPKKIASSNVKRILLIKTERIGDLVLSLPVLEQIRNNYPKSYIALVVSRPLECLLDNQQSIDEIFSYDSNMSLWGKIQFLRKLKLKRFDLSIDLCTRDFHFLPVVISFLSRAKYRAGLNNKARGFLYHEKAKNQIKPKSLTEEIFNIVRPLGVAASDEKPQIFVTDKSQQYIKDLLANTGISEEGKVIGFHPGATFESQKLPSEKFAALIELFLKEKKHKLILISDSKEKKLCEQINDLISEKQEIITEPLKYLPTLLQRCQLVICNNSGPLHIANAVGTPTVSTMGPTIKQRWWPQGENNIVIRKELDCIGCNQGKCPLRHHNCMNYISAEEMFSAAKQILGKDGI